MLSVLLIEDEKPAMERLEKLVMDFDPEIRIAGRIGSVKDSEAWLGMHPEPDLIVADIQLSDGLSHEVFETRGVQCPVIFVTAFDDHLLKALEFYCIDYVLKPVKAERLHTALNKYLKLRAHFIGNLGGFAEALRHPRGAIERLLVKRGTEMKSLPVEDIAWFYSEHKVSFAIDRQNVRYIVEKSLAELTDRLPSRMFFRLNRQYIVHIDAVKSVRPAGKGRLAVQLEPKAPREVQVSQESARDFKAWLGG